MIIPKPADIHILVSFFFFPFSCFSTFDLPISNLAKQANYVLKAHQATLLTWNFTVGRNCCLIFIWLADPFNLQKSYEKHNKNHAFWTPIKPPSSPGTSPWAETVISYLFGLLLYPFCIPFPWSDLDLMLANRLLLATWSTL